MRIRHRVPSVFSLYMVDVFCCALGCVILVWQLDMEKVKENEAAAAKTKAAADQLYAATKSDRDAAYAEIAERKAAIARMEATATSLRGTLADRADRIAALEKQLRELTDAVAAGEVKLKDARTTSAKREADLEAARAALEKKNLDLESARTALDKKATDLGTKLSDADRKLLELLAQLAAENKRTKELKSLADLVPDLKAQLATAKLLMGQLEKESEAKDDRLRKSGKSLEELKAARDALMLLTKKQGDEILTARTFEGKWKTAEEKLTALEREVAAGKTTVAAAERDLNALRAEKRAMESEVLRVRQAADNRFAGITLTGRRVIFLVDMSGSMELVDEKTPAPQKWAEVRNTLLKIMKSLPDLEKFQVIIFEENASFLLGRSNEWFDYDPKTSAAAVEASLKAIKPKGGTNMYAAMEAAFRYRARGLDTIYLLSDGLPNAGDGVPDAEARRLLELNREPELSERLAKHIRKTLKTNWNREVERIDRVRINAVGFFYESPDVGAFLWALARENDGSFVGMSKP